jgi:glutamyl-tRNA synthetase
LVLGPDGWRLAKRHGSIALREHRDRGVRPEQIVGALAASFGLVEPGTECEPAELVGKLELSTLLDARPVVL